MHSLVKTSEYQHSIFTDEPSIGNLVFDFPRYVNTLSGILLESEPKFTMGVFGNWGTGKTTLLKNIENELKEQQQCNCLFFNAWKYEQEPAHISIPLIMSILLSIYAENKSQIDKWKNENSQENLTERLHLVLNGLSLKMTFGVPGIANVDLGYDFSKPIEKKIFGISNLRKRLQQYRMEQTKIHEGIDLIKKLVESKNIKGYGKDKRLKLVVFIDDLDRCTPEKAAEIFEIIKVFLDITGIIFVLGLSNRIIELALQERYKYLKDEFKGSDYLKKIVQLPIHIPQWKPDDISDYIQSLLQGYDDYKLKEIFRDNVDMIVQGVESNPREVKRFLNLFILLHKIQDDIVPKHLLAIQAIRLRWEWFYDAVIVERSFIEQLHQYFLVDKGKSDAPTPSTASPTTQSETVNRVLREKALVEFLKGEGKIIFEIEFREWNRYKKAEVVDIKGTRGDYDISKPDENLEYFPQTAEGFSGLSKEKQDGAWNLIAKNPDFAERLGFSLGNPSFNELDWETQEKAWREAKRNDGFGKGLGASFGGQYSYLDFELQTKIWDKISGNKSFAFSFGSSLAQTFSHFEEKIQGEIWYHTTSNGEFEQGLVDGFGRVYPELDESLRRRVLELVRQGEKVAESFGYSLGSTSFKKLDIDTKMDIWREAQYSLNLTRGLAQGLGKKYSLLDDETQRWLWQNIFQQSPTEFNINFGTALGENLALLNKNTQDYVLDEGIRDDSFARGIALALSKKFFMLDKETKERVKELAENHPIFIEVFKNVNIGQMKNSNQTSSNI
jgi:hypothetical protein